MENNLKFNSAICTSRVQSEHLLSLGLKKETADCCWTTDERGNITISLIDDAVEYIEPAWSLGRLIEMMPGDVIPEGGYDNSFTLIKTYPKGYNIEYDGFSYYHKENIYDTLIEGIEHLIKEGYFNKKYLEE